MCPYQDGTKLWQGGVSNTEPFDSKSETCYCQTALYGNKGYFFVLESKCSGFESHMAEISLCCA